MKDIIKAVEAAVEKAGELFLDHKLYMEQETKAGSFNFVTKVDFAVQEYLMGELDRIIPGSNVISEESKSNLFSLQKPTWILDPVDGTTNLMHRFRHSAVSLALLLEGRLALGIVYNPYVCELFKGILDKGAYLNDEKIKVSSAKRLEESLIYFGTTPYDRTGYKADFDKLGEVFFKCRDIRRSGSAALDLAYVAAGRVDGYFERFLQPWDFAAGAIILMEAGGRITGYDGKDIKLPEAHGIIATNGLIHKELSDIINS